MKGFDYFMACYRNGLDIPVRIFAEKNAPMNFHRPEALSFINLQADEQPRHEYVALLNGLDVSIIADSVNDFVRDMAKAITEAKPRHLVVLAGDTFVSWAEHRGWK